jgi:hypothetical protein
VAARHLEASRDARRLATAAHGLGARLGAEQEAQRLDQDRLAGAGLAGDDVEALRELDRQRVDDREALDIELGQQGSDSGEWRGKPDTS